MLETQYRNTNAYVSQVCLGTEANIELEKQVC